MKAFGLGLLVVAAAAAGFLLGPAVFLARAPSAPAEVWPVIRPTATPDAGAEAVWRAADELVAGVPADAYQVAPDQLATELQEGGVTVVDVREDNEVEAGVVPGAVNVPLSSLTRNLLQLPVDKHAAIVVYCQGGLKGQLAVATLRTLGYTDVRNLAGGFNAWAQSGLPVVRTVLHTRSGPWR